MKSKLLAAIVGAAGLAATSYGQGEIIFDNYNSTPYYPTVYGNVFPPALAGTRAGADVNAELGVCHWALHCG